ncbi:Uncharacterized conserved protein [Phaffia rhodozyma]|uniref:Uncharacterized conserved protein n=1 Tax=Phaffia rhodozyma TaxID=264483 RepID=A0A0F7SIJ1_PHARH|nr:Uncharacterized conserved protein [Phaffia rhodozyma]
MLPTFNSPSSLPRLSINKDHSPRRSLAKPWLTASPTTYSGIPSTYPRSGSSGTDTRLSNILRSRTRVTNLAMVILLSVLGLSLFGNMRTWAGKVEGDGVVWEKDSDGTIGRSTGGKGKGLRIGSVKSIEDTMSKSDGFGGLDHLIVVAGHAIWTGSDPELRDQDDQWLLDPIQRGGRTVRAILEHIKAASDLAVTDAKSLLVFSGGQTRRSATHTEGQSYLTLALASSMLPHTTAPAGQEADKGESDVPSVSPFPRATSEDFALDSYENLLFSIARFKEYTSNYPKKITVVGFTLKEPRFETLHRKAIRFPSNAFEYVGIDLEGDLTEFREGEKKFGFDQFKRDLYGCHEFLTEKRRGRNVFRRWHPYHSSAPQLRALMENCPSLNEDDHPVEQDLFKGPLPWDP